MLYKMFLQWPQALRLAFDQLKRKLEDDSPAVQSCAVNVICELARRKPRNYLSLAPALFGLLTTSHNNWMLIKVRRVFCLFVCLPAYLAALRARVLWWQYGASDIHPSPPLLCWVM